MEVMPGYKQTEAGVIPEDWAVSSLGDLVTSVEYGSSAKSHVEGRVPVLRMGNLQDGQIDWNDLVYSNDDGEIQKYSLQSDDILFNRTNTIELVGKTSIFREKRPAIFAGYLIRVKVNKARLNATFLNYYFNTDTVRHHHRKVLSVAVGQANINAGKLKSYQVPLPTLAEQRAIAEALSDADALIESLEQLIAKKRHIKQGAMQELLTGKRRLPGFEGEWVVKGIVEIADCFDHFRVPLNDSQRATMRGDYPYCGANGILDYINTYCLDDSVILIAEDGGYFDEYMTRPIAYRMSGKFWVNNHAHILRSKPEFDQDFLFYSLVHKNILSFLASGTRAKLNKSEMNKITIRQPEDKAEQTAIANILSDMDAEIAALEERLAKSRQLKQGMMQELLTGRVRLV